MAYNRLPISETLTSAWEKTSGVKGQLWAVFGVIFVLNLLIGLIPSALIHLIFSPIGFLLYGAALYIGILKAQNITIKLVELRVLLDKQLILNLLGLWVIIFVSFIPFVLIILIGMMMGGIGLILGIILGIALIVFIMMRLYLAYGYILIAKLTTLEAIKQSWSATEEYIIPLVVLFLINVVMIFAGFITLLIGLIWVLPFLYVLYGEIYHRLAAPIETSTIPPAAIPPIV